MGKGMKKKILFSSIVAVIVIILASYTSVVGFQSTESSKVRLSPLFRIRSKRVIDIENKDTLTSDYLGNGKEIDLFIPDRDNQNVLLQKITYIISRMDDSEFHTLKQLLKRKVQEDPNLYQKSDYIEKELEKIRENSYLFKNYVVLHEEKTPGLITVDGIWLPGCLLASLFEIFIILFINIACILSNPLTISVP